MKAKPEKWLPHQFVRRSIIRSTVFLHITPSLLSTDVSSGSLLIARIELLYPTTASSSGIASPLIFAYFTAPIAIPSSVARTLSKSRVRLYSSSISRVYSMSFLVLNFRFPRMGYPASCNAASYPAIFCLAL